MPLRLALGDRNVELGVGETVVGREESCGLVLPDRSVSRRHAVVIVRDVEVVLRDLGSRNGTWVNGLRIGVERRLHTADRIGIGVCVLWVLHAPDGRDVPGTPEGRDDGWLALRATELLHESTSGRTRRADEIVFRLAEALEDRCAEAVGSPNAAADAALAAIIEYARLRARPGWIRWAIAYHAKLGQAPGPAVHRALDSVPPEQTAVRLRASVRPTAPTLPGSPVSEGAIPSVVTSPLPPLKTTRSA